MTKRIVRHNRHEPVWWANEVERSRQVWPLWVCVAVVGIALLGLLVTQ